MLSVHNNLVNFIQFADDLEFHCHLTLLLVTDEKKTTKCDIMELTVILLKTTFVTENEKKHGIHNSNS